MTAVVTTHRTVIEAGPGTIRRLCCGTDRSADAEEVEAALDFIDDPVALVHGQPVAVAALWAGVLRSLACPGRRSMLVIHPSWWSASRVGLVAAAARTLTGDVITRPRSSVLEASTDRVVVEIGARLVALTTRTYAGTVAEPRIGSPDQVAEAVQRRVTALTGGAATKVLIDGPPGVGGATALATMIAERLGEVDADASVELVDDTLLVAAARAEPADPQPPAPARRTRRSQRIPTLAASTALLAVAVLGAGSRIRPDAQIVPKAVPPTFLVEGRVALQVPADWPVRRVTSGPGSARVEVSSPADPQVVLHVTQSVAPGGTLTAAAESLRQAIDRANADSPPGAFVDFDPAGTSAGRLAVTYREVRDGHHIDWTVLVDGAVRISIGCQSRPGAADTVRAVCERAVLSARALSRPG